MSQQILKIKISHKIKLDFKNSKYSTDEEKIIAKVWVKKGSGKFVNGMLMIDYFKRPAQLIVTRPLEVTNVLNNYDVKCSVTGGLSGQAGAIILIISRALISHDANLKKDLKRQINLRLKSCGEKKYGHRKARRSQFSKR